MKEKIYLKGLVNIYQTDKEGNREYIVKNAENSFVDNMLRHLGFTWCLGYFNLAEYSDVNFEAYYSNIYLGSDVSTSTTHGMTALASPIGAAPGTPPDNLTGTDGINPETGVYQFSVTGVWNAGSVSGTVGELGYYMGCIPDNAEIDYGFGNAYSLGNRNWEGCLTCRLSSVDGDFDSFTIDISKSLTVQWVFKVVFK